MEQKQVNAKNYLIILISFLVLIISFIISISIGSVTFTFKEVVYTLLGRGTELSNNIIFNLRVPRAILNILVGINLAISGVLLQTVMKNPLADPGLTGVSSGGAFVAIIIMLMFPQLTHIVPFAAFLGAMATCLLIYSLAWKKGLDPVRIILAGVAINAILGSGTSLLSILYSDRIQGVLLWVNGSMAGKNIGHVRLLLPYSIIGVTLSFLCIKQVNVLQLGDDMSRNLGYNPNLSRVLISAVAAFLAGISVAVVGIIGFVGLVVPHVARMIIGSDYKYLLPLTGIFGAILIIVADTFARTAFAPIELPVGIVMAVIGGPFFLYLLRKRS